MPFNIRGRPIWRPDAGSFALLRRRHAGRTTVTTNFLVMKLAEQGLGVAIIDSFTASSANRARVKVVPLTPGIAVELKSLVRFQGKLSHPARSFIKTFGAVAQACVAKP